MDLHDHPLDHMLPKEFVVPIMVDALDMKIIFLFKKYKIYHIQISDKKYDWKKSHKSLQLVVVEVEVCIAPEVTMKDPIQNEHSLE
jgi:hypothetical protein